MQRQSGYLRHLVRGAYPGRHGLYRPALPRRHDPRQRRFFQRLHVLLPAQRRIRAAASDLGIQPGAGQQGSIRRPRDQSGAGINQNHRLVQSLAMEEGPFASEVGAGLRGVPAGDMDAQRIRRLLEAARPLRRGALRYLVGRATASFRQLVRLLYSHHLRQLRGAFQDEKGACAPAHGPLDPRPAFPQLLGRGRLRRTSSARWQPCPRLRRLSPCLVRTPGSRDWKTTSKNSLPSSSLSWAVRRRPHKRTGQAQPRRSAGVSKTNGRWPAPSTPISISTATAR